MDRGTDTRRQPRWIVWPDRSEYGAGRGRAQGRGVQPIGFLAGAPAREDACQRRTAPDALVQPALVIGLWVAPMLTIPAVRSLGASASPPTRQAAGRQRSRSLQRAGRL